MKRKIKFEITVGSKWVDGFTWPQGGAFQFRIIEFETDKPENSMRDAEDALRKAMGVESYHIWYWDWMD